MAKFILQRALEGRSSFPTWFDAEKFDDREPALRALKFAKADAQHMARDHVGRRVQAIRVVQTVE
jgi:hypothetical protein